MALLDVLEYEGGNDILVYRAPQTDFNTHSTLGVRESQEAIFFRDGKMLDIFGPGRYVLHTGNIPLLSKLINLPSGGVSPFQCEVYFVNRALALNHKWGTSSQARVYDHTYDLILTIGANGTMGIRIADPRKVLLSIVGTEPQLTAEQCLEYFRENISMKVKEYIAQAMRQPDMDFMVLDTQLTEFSQKVKELLNEEFADVGVEIYNFLINNIHVPEEQYEAVMVMQQKRHYQRQKEFDMRGDLQLQMLKSQGDRATLKVDAEGEAERRKIQAVTDAEIANMQIDLDARRVERMGDAAAHARQVQGYNWADEQQADVAKTYAASGTPQNNPASFLAQAPMAMAFGDMLRDNIEPVMTPNYSNPGINFGNGFGVGQAQTSPFAMPEVPGAMDGVEPLADPATPAPETSDPLQPRQPAQTPPAPEPTCPMCGTKVPMTAKFCPMCGTKIQQEPVVCQCGHIFAANEKFCPECGSPKAK